MNETVNKRVTVCESDGSLSDLNKQKLRKTSQGLMTKLGKSDLLRLLSILEGELEAQDIIIAELQTRLHIDDNVKKDYFHYKLTDPFLALVRDNEVLNKGSQKPSFSHNQVPIEPLPLLEKVVTECKKQQVKVRQHLALSDAYYKLVNRELVEIKRKHAVESQVGDDVTAALEKNREKLQLQIRVECAKNRKLQNNYKNLLQFVSNERSRFQLIITMLLEERYGNNMKPVNVDDMPLDELKDGYRELLCKSQSLEAQVDRLKENETSLKEEINQLKQHLAQIPQMQWSVSTRNNENISDNDLRSCKGFQGDSDVGSSSFLSASNESMHRVVTVKRTSTVLEKKKVSQVKMKPKASNSCSTDGDQRLKVSSTSDETSALVAEASLRLAASGIVSSPTSGASNFALDSPNQPSSSSFPTPVLPAKNRKSNPSSSFQATRQKFQRFSSPKPSPPSTSKHEVQHSNRPIKICSETTSSLSSSDDPLPSVPSSCKSETKSLSRKLSDNNGTHMPQPPKPPKLSSNSLKPTKDQDKEIITPPLPPKKCSLSKSNSLKASTVRTPRDVDSHKKNDRVSQHSSDSLHRVQFQTKVSQPTKHSGGQVTGNSRLNAKRPASLNTNSNNNNNNNLNRATPKIPGSAPASLSAQHRLFPPQDGSSGQLFSPVTKTVPKSPLESYMFTFR